MFTVTGPFTTDAPRKTPSFSQRSATENPRTSQYHLIDASASFAVDPTAISCSPFAGAAAGFRAAFALDRGAAFAFEGDFFGEDFERALLCRFIFFAIVENLLTKHLTTSCIRTAACALQHMPYGYSNHSHRSQAAGCTAASWSALSDRRCATRRRLLHDAPRVHAQAPASPRARGRLARRIRSDPQRPGVIGLASGRRRRPSEAWRLESRCVARERSAGANRRAEAGRAHLPK